MENKKLSVLLVGVGGYGGNYVDEMLNHPDRVPDTVLVGAVDPAAEKCFFYNRLVEAGVPIYANLEDFYAEHTADLAVLSTPIHFHKDQTIDCLQHGTQVLCEKPVCATIDDVHEMEAARDAAGLPVSIGYQWSHSEPIQHLKKDILAGVLGRPVRMKTLVLWPRDFAYYNRGSGWAGKKSVNGHWILDSVASNATAHYLHNMFFVSGPAMDRSADVADITVETYRANNIETYDTCILRGHLQEGAEILFVVSHAIAKDQNYGPVFEYEFEKGTVKFFRTDEDTEHMTAYLNDGRVIEYGSPSANVIRKFHWAIAVAQGREAVVCGPEAASIHTKCVNAITQMIPDTPVFPEAITVHDEEHQMVYCEGLADVLHQCYETRRLPSELGVAWAKAPQTMDLTHYNSFTPSL